MTGMWYNCYCNVVRLTVYSVHRLVEMSEYQECLWGKEIFIVWLILLIHQTVYFTLDVYKRYHVVCIYWRIMLSHLHGLSVLRILHRFWLLRIQKFKCNTKYQLLDWFSLLEVSTWKYKNSDPFTIREKLSPTLNAYNINPLRTNA